VRSDQSTLCNARAGWKKGWLTFAVDVLNVFDVEDHDVDYYYSSQLSGEASPVDDIHFHPVEPRTVRASVTARF
jgi:outer membrane receptor protein involved in Fe transport